MKIRFTPLRHRVRSKLIRKQGFTLMELLVYMAIVGIVVVIAGEAFSNSTKFRIRTDNMIRATQEAESVAMLFKEDVAQMGSKNSKEAGPALAGSAYGVKFGQVNSKIYIDPENIDPDKKDSSSFILDNEGLKKKNGYSDLTFLRLRYDDNGYYQAVERIRWYVDPVREELMRSCSIDETADGVTIEESDPCHEDSDPVLMASGVKKFTVQAAMPGVKEELAQIFPPLSSPNEFRLVPRAPESGFVPAVAKNPGGLEDLGGSEITISDFSTNYKNSDGTDGGILPEGVWVRNQFLAIKNVSTPSGSNWSQLCNDYGKMTFHPDTVYEISFELRVPNENDKSLMFVPGTDHMSVGFRKAGSGDFAKKEDKVILPDFMFFPPLDAEKGNGKRVMRFTVPERIDNVCLAFTFAFFSPLAPMGKVKIKNVKVRQVASSTYKFVDGYDPEEGNNKKEKKNIKALKLNMQISRGAKNNGKGETGEVNLIIHIPSNGPRD